MTEIPTYPCSRCEILSVLQALDPAARRESAKEVLRVLIVAPLLVNKVAEELRMRHEEVIRKCVM